MTYKTDGRVNRMKLAIWQNKYGVITNVEVTNSYDGNFEEKAFNEFKAYADNFYQGNSADIDSDDSNSYVLLDKDGKSLYSLSIIEI